MKIFADLHVHYYPSYSLGEYLANIFTRLAELITDPSAELGLIALTETQECHFFQDLQEGKVLLPEGYQLEVLDGAVQVQQGKLTLIIIPGRQVNTSERIELLSLGSDDQIESGKSLRETVGQIDAASAVAVLNWAPGKWWFQRGKLIKDWIAGSREPRVICDTSLRPLGYLEPILTRQARRKNWSVIYGSDPLPDSQEQKNVFKYFACYDCSFDLEKPLGSFREMIKTNPKVLGKRSSFWELFGRMHRYFS